MVSKIRLTLKKIAGTKILCLGDLMLDRYVYGQATRLSPEAPVPIVQVRRQTHVPGGLGNVVMNLSSLGAWPLAAGLTGCDPAAEILAELLQGALDHCSPPLVRDPTRPTTIKTRVIAGIQQVVRFDEESETPLDSKVGALYREAVSTALGSVSAVAVSDYGKGVITPSFCRWLIKKTEKLSLPVVFDPKGDDYSRYRGAALVTPNRQELAAAAGRDIARAQPEVLISAGLELMNRHGLKNLLITRSEEGMTLVSPPDSVRHLPARAKEVFDVSGAGDTVVAAVAACLGANLTLEEGAELATAAAGVVVGKVGTAVATPQEILNSL
ncbi:MAG: D-glycero-beta-D-manno-heptose-7-phosphate kinase [Deltaproteobacteria bacterium]|jgi:D-beta-D-heptose 7-phosphate kinase/D-beta-D-heptose 1-phosphate adenosyltransferase|nr:D-glycero-beta-D-manno-heptose-7-phosphate kinase [Deltaproteobacteria bacterium]